MRLAFALLVWAPPLSFIRGVFLCLHFAFFVTRGDTGGDGGGGALGGGGGGGGGAGGGTVALAGRGGPRLSLPS